MLALRKGNTLTAAAEAAGIRRETLHDWLEQGEADARAGRNGEKRHLYHTVKKALAEAETRKVGVIDKAGTDGTWTAAAWWLERRRPSDWGKPPERVTVETEPITINIQLPDGTTRQLTRGKPPALPSP